MHTRFALPLGFCLVLAACGGSAASACDSAYWDGTVGTCLPDGWIVLERSAMDEQGLSSDVIAAFERQKPVAGQFPTVTVTRETLTEEVPSADYSTASMQLVESLPAYESIDTKAQTIDEQDVTLNIFSAQPRTEDPAVKFYQMSITSGRAGYTFTAGVPLSVDSDIEEEILLIMENATLKTPGEEEEN